MKKIFTLSLTLGLIISCQLTVSAQFRILKDAHPNINEGVAGPNNTYATYNGDVYFTGIATDMAQGFEGSNKGLWKTDGTPEGTVRVRANSFVGDITNANGTLFFSAENEISGSDYRSLWKSDGTAAGTVQVKDVSFGFRAQNYTSSTNNLITAVNGIVYFLGKLPAESGLKLWKSDGTEGGTVMVKDIWPTELENVNGTLFFSASGLWKSDGTTAGTVQVSTTTATEIINYNGTAIFRGNAGLATDGLWKSNGTAAGTIQLTSTIPSNLRVVNNKILFVGGNSLWTSDGTPAGTFIVYTNSTPGQVFTQIVSSANIAYFITQTTPGNLRELWKSDGTAAGTVKVTDLLPNSTQNMFSVLSNDKLLFANSDAVVGTEVWVSDGTSGGTALIKDIYTGFKGCNPKNFYVAGNVAYFSGLDGIHGQELWKTDGTLAGTLFLKDTYSPTGSSNPANFFNLNNTRFLFTATNNIPVGTNPTLGNELHQSDGLTTSGTGMVKNINPVGGSGITGITLFNNLAFFSANNLYNGTELWKSDGTDAGTELLDINANTYPDIRHSNPSGLKVVGSYLYFSATGSSTSGQELWKTDGTIAGSVMVKDINPGTGNSNPSFITGMNGSLFFSADDGAGNELWKSDGTEAGTVKLTDHPFGGSPTNLIEVNGTLFYSYNSGTTIGRELFSNNGNEGLNLVKDIKFMGNSNPTSMTNFNGILFFVADGDNGTELFKSDGTNAGTVMVKDIVPGGGSSSPQSLMVLNGSLYFSADDGINGREIWKTDGTEAGTVMVKDINLGGSSNPVILAKIGFRIYFSANDGINGNELWVTDGTTGGTSMVQDIEPGAGSSSPSEMIEVNGKMYVAVFNSAFGREVWFAPVPNDSPLPLTLLEFKGSLQNDNGVLQWKTENEYNTSTFVIERSTDGRSYKSIGTVNALNASGVNHYDYTDANIKALGASIVYYRLRQTDADNKFTYSRIVALAIDNKQSFAMLYPNPVNSEINLTITLVKKQRLNWQLVGNNGHIVRSGIFNLSAGSTTTSIDASQLSKGNYILLLNGESLQQTIKVIKQ